MKLGYIYMFDDGTIQQVYLKGALNKLIDASNEVDKRSSQIVCRWTVKRKV